MAIREYKCKSCGLMMEEILPINSTPPASMTCKRCGEQAEFKSIPSSVGLLTENFSEQKVDVAIGKDAARRWQDISDRQAVRDRVREQSGQAGLSMVGRNEFAPLAEGEKVARTEATAAVLAEGYKHQPDTATDKKLVGSD